MSKGLAAVTGASSGIGRAIAVALASNGYRVAALGRNEAALASLTEEIEQAGGSATRYVFDVTDDAEVIAFADALAPSPPLAALVHSAGVIEIGPVATATVDALDRHYRVNVRAPYLLTQCLLPRLRQAQGQVVFINSGAGWSANAEWSHYAASKFALRALADSLRAEEQDNGVRVASVYPGRIASPMQASLREMEGKPYDPNDYAQPEDVAQQVCALLALPPRAAVTDVRVRPTGR